MRFAPSNGRARMQGGRVEERNRTVLRPDKQHDFGAAKNDSLRSPRGKLRRESDSVNAAIGVKFSTAGLEAITYENPIP
jgi:hypothetical protein